MEFQDTLVDDSLCAVVDADTHFVIGSNIVDQNCYPK
ncbi:hypothetical protein OROGR_012252 [Orobanche gracilis]